MLRILLVDGDRDTTDALALVFEGEGWQAVAAADAGEALAILENDAAYDVVLLDVSLPLGKTTAFLREKERRTALSPVPVVVMTADVNVPETIDGVVRVLRKPFAIDFVMMVVCHAATFGLASRHAATAGDEPGRA